MFPSRVLTSSSMLVMRFLPMEPFARSSRSPKRPPPVGATAIPLLIGQLSLAPAPTSFAPGSHLGLSTGAPNWGVEPDRGRVRHGSTPADEEGDSQSHFRVRTAHPPSRPGTATW